MNSSHRSSSVKSWLQFASAIILGLLLLSWSFYQIEDFQLFLNAFRRLKLPLFLLAASFSWLIILLNTIQLKLFLPDYGLVKFRKMYHLVSVFSMTVNLLPFWGGHALFIYLLGHREKKGKTVALSVMTLDQIIEGFAKLFIFGVVAFSFSDFMKLPSWLLTGIKSFLVAVVIIYSIIFLMAFYFRDHIEKVKGPPVGLMAHLRHLIYRWAFHLKVLRNLPSLILTIAMAIFMKMMEVLAVYVIQIGLGFDLGLQAAFLVVAALSLATSLPLSPSRIGIFEFAAQETYRFLGLNAADGLALGILIHIAHTLPFVLAGYASSLNLGFRQKHYQEHLVLEGSKAKQELAPS